MFDSNHVHQAAFLNRVHDHIAVRTAKKSSSAGVEATSRDGEELLTRVHATVSKFVREAGSKKVGI